jgi:hypothetical protein
MSISAHRSLDGLCIVHSKLLEYVACVLYLTNESPFFGLLDLKYKKECENSHHGYFKSIGDDFAKLIIKGFVSRIKDNIINIYLAYKQIFPIFLLKRVESALPILKPFSIRKSLRHSYYALSACLSS